MPVASGIMAPVRSMARVLLVGSLVLVACSSSDVDRAFRKVDDALPSQLRQVTEGGGTSSQTARYEAEGEPAEVAALVRSALASQGFMFFPGSGLPDPSVTQPPPPSRPILAPSGENPVNLGPPPTTEPRAVDAIYISGFRGQRYFGMMVSISFHFGPRPGWTLVILATAAQD